MKSSQVLVGLCAFAALSLTSCSEIRSANPLSDRNKAKVDENAIGGWVGKLSESTNIDIEIARHPLAGKGDPKFPSGMMVVKVKDSHPDNKRREVPFFVTVIGKEHYYNLALKDRPRSKEPLPKGMEEDPDYGIGKYEVKDGTLTVFHPIEPVDVIKKGLLKGEVRHGGPVGQEMGILTDTTENLANFIADGNSKSLFKNEGVALRKKLR